MPKILNESVKTTASSVIAEIQTFMAGKRIATPQELLAECPSLSDMGRGEIEQAVIDAGFKVIE